MSSTAVSTVNDQEKQQPPEDNVVVSPVSGDVVTYPEGGWAGWLTVLGSALILCATFGVSLSFGVLEDHYTREFLNKSSASDVSWIGSSQLIAPSIGLPAGKFFDDGHYRLLMISGTVVYLFSFFMLSICQPNHFYQVFLAQGVGMGIGMGLVFVPAVALPSHYFRAKRSLVMGLVFAGSAMGGIIFPIILNQLINSPSIGFAWGIRTVAFIAAILLLIGNLLSKPRLPTKKERAPEHNAVLRLILKDVPYWLSVWGSCLILWGLFFPYFYLQLYAVLHGVDEGMAFYIITVLNAATFFARILPNYVADKYGVLNVAIPMTTVSGGLVFAMLNLKSVASLFIFAAFYGCESRIGIAMFLIAFFLLTGAPLTGALLRVHPPEYTWWRGVIFSGIVQLFGVSLIAVSRSMFVRRKGTWKV
ncbi:MFS general substrate transporter [Mycena belliarum]|uniref:MFS general substrate transporter n=1 Tax=Mycena belliarum TaxID=1033014 RepID=A0AAD6XM56_9AGAR|nr:MFS general substrate transporter [Mycena belliae]